MSSSAVARVRHAACRGLSRRFDIGDSLKPVTLYRRGALWRERRHAGNYGPSLGAAAKFTAATQRGPAVPRSAPRRCSPAARQLRAAGTSGLALTGLGLAGKPDNGFGAQRGGPSSGLPSRTRSKRSQACAKPATSRGNRALKWGFISVSVGLICPERAASANDSHHEKGLWRAGSVRVARISSPRHARPPRPEKRRSLWPFVPASPLDLRQPFRCSRSSVQHPRPPTQEWEIHPRYRARWTPAPHPQCPASCQFGTPTLTSPPYHL